MTHALPDASAPMFPLIDVSQGATPLERGRLYGAAARDRCAVSRSTYARLFAHCGIDWTAACARALGYREAIAAVDGDLLDEMAGIAQGAGLDLAEVLALNCRSEILPPSFLGESDPEAAARALAANRALGLPDWLDGAPLDPAAGDGECTAMAVAATASANGHTWFAQNWDWIGRQRPALVLLRSHDGRGTAFTTLTEAGMLAKIGVNSHGFALGLNILRSRGDGVRPGVAVHVLLRHLLSVQTLEQARRVLADLQRRLGFGAASNIPCADAAGNVASFEVAPAGWAECHPADGVVVHTNHFLCAPLQPEQVTPASPLSTELRLATAQRHALPRPLDRAALERFLRDETDGLLSVCRSPDPALAPEARVESVAGVLIDCDARAMWVAPDVPSRVAFGRVA